MCVKSKNITMSFDCEHFVETLSEEGVRGSKTSELLDLCKCYDLNVRRSMRKAEILESLMTHLIDDKSAWKLLERNISESFELRKLELEIQTEKEEREFKLR